MVKDIDKASIVRLRKISPERSLKEFFRLNNSLARLTLMRLKTEYPKASEKELLMKARKIYGSHEKLR